MGVYRLMSVWSVLFLLAVVSSSFDVNDILSPPMMPVSWLMLDNPLAIHAVSDGEQSNNLTHFPQTKSDGSFDIAYSTMGFHRKMIKEYMCSNFLASNILHQVAPSHFQQRLGLFDNGTELTKSSEYSNEENTLVNTMKFDQGSKGYKDWLSRTTTLDDIYRHYISPNANSTKPQSTVVNHRVFSSSRRQDKPVHEDYEEGDVTGYAVQMPHENLGGLYSYQHPQLGNYNHHQGYEHFPTADSKAVFPFSSGSFETHENVFPSEQNFEQPPDVFGGTLYSPISKELSLKQKIWNYINPFNLFTEHHQDAPTHYNSLGYEYPSHGSDSYGTAHGHSGGSSKDMGLKDMFDIALTTLAFLSFGMFFLQVLMCVTMSKSENSNMMMLPMEEVTGDGGTAETRKRRSTTGNGNSGLSLAFMNELTKTVLISIDAVEMSETDNGKCLRYAQCESNKMSRDLENSQKIWIPVWNLGISWLASRVIVDQPKASSILESLKASAYGLGRADCSKMYTCSKKYQLKERK